MQSTHYVRIFVTSFGKFIETTVFISTELQERKNESLVEEMRTFLPGELNLNVFLSFGADLERSLFSPRRRPPFPSSRKGFRSKNSFGCMLSLKTGPFMEVL